DPTRHHRRRRPAQGLARRRLRGLRQTPPPPLPRRGRRGRRRGHEPPLPAGGPRRRGGTYIEAHPRRLPPRGAGPREGKACLFRRPRAAAGLAGRLRTERPRRGYRRPAGSLPRPHRPGGRGLVFRAHHAPPRPRPGSSTRTALPRREDRTRREVPLV
ncbi:MAG: 23S rRNA (pseudouridine(1915)-N(3))-methyltransferase, partial [uncultured Rubrobacteraceae bacterium]